MHTTRTALVLCFLFVISASRLLSNPSQSREYESHWAVHLHDGKLPYSLEDLGFDVVGRVANLENVYEIRHRETHARFKSGVHKKIASPHITDALLSHPHVRWAEQQYLVEHSKRASFADPLFSSQWHLVNTGQFGGVAGVDVNIQGAWDKGFNGSGIVIAIVDDGYQYTHPDLEAHYSAAYSRNFNSGSKTDPAPDVTEDFHGTPAAGVALAAANSVCGVGAAYMATGSGIRLISQAVTTATEATGISYMNQNNMIYSNSWGPSDDGHTMGAASTLTINAIANSVATGRGGKGNIYVWAAGNGGEHQDNCNYDGYANNRHVIAVGAVGNNGKQSYYSESGAPLLVVAPSGRDTVDGGIRTSDLLGGNGYSSTDCDNSFSGTSSACPLVAGITALVLQANPNLGWRDVQFILATTAKKIDATDSDWVNNAAGYHVNHKYGFGIVDATAAVDAALAYTTNLPAEITANASDSNVKIIGSDEQSTILTLTSDMIVESITVTVSIAHQYCGDLRITVTSPQGTQSVLAAPHASNPAVKIGSDSIAVLSSSFSPAPTIDGISGTIFATVPDDACASLTNCNDLSGAIAYIKISYCDFYTAAKRAQDCGATAVIMWDSTLANGALFYPLDTVTNKSLNIPCVSMSYADQDDYAPAGEAAKVYLYRYELNGYNPWTFTSKRHLGESAQGNWVVNVSKTYTTGTWSNTAINIYGHVASVPSTTSTSGSSNSASTTSSSLTSSTSSNSITSTTSYSSTGSNSTASLTSSTTASSNMTSYSSLTSSTGSASSANSTSSTSGAAAIYVAVSVTQQLQGDPASFDEVAYAANLQQQTPGATVTVTKVIKQRAVTTFEILIVFTFQNPKQSQQQLASSVVQATNSSATTTYLASQSAVSLGVSTPVIASTSTVAAATTTTASAATTSSKGATTSTTATGGAATTGAAATTTGPQGTSTTGKKENSASGVYPAALLILVSFALAL